MGLCVASGVFQHRSSSRRFMATAIFVCAQRNSGHNWVVVPETQLRAVLVPSLVYVISSCGVDSGGGSGSARSPKTQTRSGRPPPSQASNRGFFIPEQKMLGELKRITDYPKKFIGVLVQSVLQPSGGPSGHGSTEDLQNQTTQL